MANKIKNLQAKLRTNEKNQNALRIRQMQLHNERNDLQHQLNLSEGYKEKVEMVRVGRKLAPLLIGRKHWKEEFRDEDGGESVFVERSALCTINGKPCDQFGQPLQYYDIQKEIKSLQL